MYSNGHHRRRRALTIGRIIGSWVLAVALLLGALYAVQSHGTYSLTQTSGSCGGYWVPVTAVGDASIPAYVNLAASTQIIRGTLDDKPATLVWSGGTATGVTEMPDEVLKLKPVKMGC